MLLLVARDEPLGPAWLDHPLVGEWGGSSRMPCWRRFLFDLSALSGTSDGEQVIFVGAGTHSDLFE